MHTHTQTHTHTHRANAGDVRDAASVPGLGRSHGGGHGNPLQYSCLENSTDRAACGATVLRVAKSQTRLKRLACLSGWLEQNYHCLGHSNDSKFDSRSENLLAFYLSEGRKSTLWYNRNYIKALSVWKKWRFEDLSLLLSLLLLLGVFEPKLFCFMRFPRCTSDKKSTCQCRRGKRCGLESPLDCKEIQPVHPKGNQSWILIGSTDVLILWLPDGKNWLTGKDPDAGKDWRQEEKGRTEDEMVGWHHQLNGHEFE